MKININARPILQPIRDCGERTEFGFYLSTMEGSEDGCLPAFSEMDTPIPVQRKPHRGPLIVDGEKILARHPEEEWVAGNSAKTQEKNRSDQVDIATYGMTLAKRIEVGDCKGSKTNVEAVECLLSKVQYDRRITEIIRSMTIAGIAEQPNCAQYFSGMIRNIQNYVLSEEPVHLVFAAAQVWQLAEKCPVKNRDLFVSDCSRMLTLLGLPRDGMAVYMQYSGKKSALTK